MDKKSIKTKKNSPVLNSAEYSLSSAVVRGAPKEEIDHLRKLRDAIKDQEK